MAMRDPDNFFYFAPVRPLADRLRRRYRQERWRFRRVEAPATAGSACGACGSVPRPSIMAGADMDGTVIDTAALGSGTGIEVSRLGLGLWAVAGSEWGPGDDAATLEAIEVALERGVTFFDTADKYAEGHSEALLGRAMQGRRDRFVVATKIGWEGFDDERRRSAYDTPEQVERGVEASLRRLGTDHIEVIQCHIDFDEPNTDSFLEGFRRLLDAGKVGAWGVSTGTLDRLEQFNAAGDCNTLQIDYSILNRTPEEQILPYCARNGIGVIVRGPLAMGLLADKFSPTDAFVEGDFRRGWTTDPEQHEQFLADLETVAELRSLVPEGQSMAQLALRFVLDHPAVTTVIPGARNRRQAESNSTAAQLPPLTDTARQAIDAIVPPGGGRRIWPA
jgi:aryl-alcohol dehydrogenase-like predicted oxidoreductase